MEQVGRLRDRASVCDQPSCSQNYGASLEQFGERGGRVRASGRVVFVRDAAELAVVVVQRLPPAVHLGVCVVVRLLRAPTASSRHTLPGDTPERLRGSAAAAHA